MFNTQVLDKAIRRRCADRENKRLAMLQKTTQALIDIQSRFECREAYIVGSLLVENRWCDTSDVDVALSGCSNHLLAVMKVLEDATGRDVDVIDLDIHSFAEQFRRHGIKIYG